MRRPRFLIGCEYSGTVRDACIRAGYDAISCDILPSESDFGPHYQGDIFDMFDVDRWGVFDVGIFHPPCTYLCNAGVRWLYDDRFPDRWQQMEEGAAFFRALLNAPIPMIALENPRMHKHARELVGRRADQTVQPWEFGHTETKGVGLWLRGLPPLLAGQDARAAMMQLPYAERARVHSAPPGPDRGKVRSLFFPGIADAMAEQWGAFAQERVAA